MKPLQLRVTARRLRNRHDRPSVTRVVVERLLRTGYWHHTLKGVLFTDDWTAVWRPLLLLGQVKGLCTVQLEQSDDNDKGAT